MTDRSLYSDVDVRRALVAAVLVLLVVFVGAFVLDAETDRPDPVAFSDTTTLGIPDEDRLALRERGLSVPEVQVFYSQYIYVVGYEGVERAIETLQEPAHEQQFGQPLTIYVTDYSGTDIEVTAEGYLDVTGQPGWVSADEARYVVGSDARTPVSETVVPFGAESDAQAFAETHGGSVESWSSVRAHDFDLDDATAVRENVPELHNRGDERLAAVQPLLDRDVSVVVGADEPTVQDAIDSAPADSTVLVPDGTYDEHVEIHRPITLRGENATLRGDGNGTVLEITHDDAAVTGMNITGIGEETRGEPETEEDHGAGDDWESAVETGYGYSDAGIWVVGAEGVYVHDVRIETPASGVLYRDAPEGVVEGLTIEGTDVPMDGFMGVLSIRSPVVVENSTFDGGRDGIYLHRADESVIRNSTFVDNRFGVHFMYTSDSLIADNVARGQTSAGITIMTNPARNAVVGNDVQEAVDGIIPGGSRSYIADNVVAHNDRGMMGGTSQSVYEGNVIYGNNLGMRSGSILPSNVIRENDFVDNEEHASAGIGPLRVWTDKGAGNYWDGAYGDAVGDTLDRSYSPTDPVEKRFHRTDGSRTLGESPAAKALAEVRATSPGLRRGSIVDTAPLAEPANPDVLDALSGEEPGTVLSLSHDESQNPTRSDHDE